ncbi:TPA: 50S ribosomal protein P1 [Candidatus Woesearchaeota archaeon]|nr:50S ribosomal protein P1 [Candidatus Woesearchaeota archaeon]HII68606.1 50S ribosomal protein P1 [Candidatus Woesearchaeota archaeon]
MEYIYAAMLLHKAGQKVEEAAVKRVLDAGGVKANEARIKALVASLEGVDIDKAIETAAVPVAAAVMAAAPASEGKKEAKKEEKKEDDKKTEEAAAAGLGALFG